MTSWKTTLAGVLQFLAVAGQQLAMLFDGDPGTNPEWNLVIGSLIVLFGLGTARDNGVSSEQAGVK